MSATASAICVSLNGEERRMPEGMSVTELLEQIGLDRRKVAVERNEAIVPRSAYGETTLRDGDKLEIVHFIGGG